MKAGRNIAANTDWRQFLRLGEELLDQTKASEQCRIIQKTIEDDLGGKAKVWLAEPFYPLPGELELPVLPSADVPDLVRESLSNGNISYLIAETHTRDSCCTQTAYRAVAVPIRTLQNVMGIIWLDRGEENPIHRDEIEYLEGIAAHAALSMQTNRQVVIKNWRFEQLSLVRSVSSQITRFQNLDDLCSHVTRLIQQTFGFYFVTIFTLDEQGTYLQYRGSAGQNDITVPAYMYKIRLGEGMVGNAAAEGREIIATEVKAEPTFVFLGDLPDTKAEVSLPLKVGDRILGVLDLQSDEARAFHEFDMIVLRALADNIAIAVEGSRLYNHLQQRADHFSALLELSHSLTSILNIDDLMDEVVKTIQKYFGYPFVHLFLVHPGRRRIFYETGGGARSRAMAENAVAYDLDSPSGMIPWVARNGKTLLANDITLEPLYIPSSLPPSNTMAELAIPIVYGDQVLAVLDLQSDQKNSFEENNVNLLEAFSASIAIAIRNARLYQSETWRRQVADSFRDVAGLVSANIGLDNLLEKILVELERNLPCEVAAIWLVEESYTSNNSDGHYLRLAAVHGAPAEKITQSIEEFPEVKAFLEKVLEMDDPNVRSPLDPLGPLGKAMDFPQNYSSIAAPLRAGEEPLGILTLAHSTSGRYGSEAQLISATFANYAAVAIQNNRFYASSQEQAWISTILLQVAEASQSVFTVEELFDTMARLTPLLIGVKHCALFAWNEARQEFNLKSHYGLDLPLKIDLTLGSDVPAMQQLLTTRTAVFVDDALHDLQIPAAAVSENNGTLVLLPLLARGQILGAYLVGHQVIQSNTRFFDQQTLSILQGIAQQISIAAENIRLIEARQEEAYVTAVLLQVAQAVVSQNDLGDILDTVIHLMPILVGIDACAIYLWEESKQAFQAVKVYTGSHTLEHELEGKLFPPGHYPLLDAVHNNDQLFAVQIIDPELPLEQWSLLDSLLADEFVRKDTTNANWVMGFPLSVKGEVFGVLLAKEANVPSAFHERRIEIINGIAQQVALAIQNEKLNLEMVERERLEREIQLARQIQKTFLPNRIPEIPGWNLDIHWQTARQVGGDFYDIFKLSKGRLGIVIADVSDKGMPAALYMTVARTLIRAFVQNSDSPAKVLERVNRLLSIESPNSMFVTVVYAILSLESGELTFANAGHNLPLLLRIASKKAEFLPRGGMALGVMNDVRYIDHQIPLEEGDALILYTDGVTESFSLDGEPFGEQRLKSTIEQTDQESIPDLLEKIIDTLQNYRSGNSPSDDLTLVLIHRKIND